MTDEVDVAVRARAFRELAEGSVRDALRLADAILRDAAEAEDAVQDAFVAGWEKWSTLRDPSRFDAWFRRIVVNVCRERLRRRRRRPAIGLEASMGVPAPTSGLDVHDRMLLEQGIARLEPDDRLILALRYYRDLKVDDIAAALEVSPGTVKSRLSRAVARLRAEVDASGRDGGSR